MPTIDEIFAALPEEPAQDAHEFLVIDPATRTITVPKAESVFGVEEDKDSERKYFISPRYVGDNLDLAACFLSIKYRNANGEKDQYLITDTAINGEYVTFSWLLSEKVVKYKGPVQFRFDADTAAGPAWGTTNATGTSLEGMEPEIDSATVEEETSDVVTQLRAMVTAQTAAVEDTGAAQVQAVQTAGAAATSDAQAQIEAKGAATLATIPDDYTTMAGKVNEHANAIKGAMFGKIVRADDVSPVEHCLAVSVRSKNLIPYPFAEETTTRDGVTFTVNEDGGLHVAGTPTQNTSFNLVMQYTKNCLLKKGRLYTLTVASNLTAETGYIYFQAWANGAAHMSKSIRKGSDSFTLTEDGYLQLGVVLLKGMAIDETVYCQLEQGPATEYAAYVDPSTVTVTRCGKNLAGYTGETKTDTSNGLSLTRTQNSAVFTLDGTSTAMTSLVATSTILLPPGTYTASVKGLNVNDASAGLDRVYLWDQPNGKVVANGIMTGVPKTFTLEAVTAVRAEIVAGSGSTYSSKKVKIQIELGAAATDFEEFTMETAMPATDGTVGGLTSLAPSMTIFSDTENVTVECEYNRDSNAVYAELLAKIAAMSGTT